MLANLDFALIIVVLTALAGVIWLFDSLFLRSGRVAKAARGEPVKEPVVVEYARSFFPILLIVLGGYLVLSRSGLFNRKQDHSSETPLPPTS